jgi:hypothetical protein
MAYTFVFRYALCAYLHALHWIAVGGGKDRKDEKFAHDFVDVAIVTYATCFDGLLTKDKLAMEIYKNANTFSIMASPGRNLCRNDHGNRRGRTSRCIRQCRRSSLSRTQPALFVARTRGINSRSNVSVVD